MAPQILIWAGAAFAGAGLLGIIWCMIQVQVARRQGDATLRARMVSILPVNLAALAVATIGLLCVIVGIVLR